MSELSELYQEVILDHNKRPHNFRKLDNANRTAEGYNPLCGDQLAVYARLDDDVIIDISFEGSGCAISKASASLMTDSIKGKTVAQAKTLFEQVHTMLTEERQEQTELESLGKLAVLSGVWEFPARVKCASLAWHTLQAALKNEQAPVTTE
jgi:nitrogen fixation protein NifU and related proteins